MFLILFSIVGYLVDKFNFLINIFIRIFIVVFLFGIGIDYNFLIILRFREEFVNGKDVDDVILMIFKMVGKIVIFSCFVVFIGFVVFVVVFFNFFRVMLVIVVSVFVFLFVFLILVLVVFKIFGKNFFWLFNKEI